MRHRLAVAGALACFLATSGCKPMSAGQFPPPPSAPAAAGMKRPVTTVDSLLAVYDPSSASAGQKAREYVRLIRSSSSWDKLAKALARIRVPVNRARLLFISAPLPLGDGPYKDGPFEEAEEEILGSSTIIVLFETEQDEGIITNLSLGAFQALDQTDPFEVLSTDLSPSFVCCIRRSRSLKACLGPSMDTLLPRQRGSLRVIDGGEPFTSDAISLELIVDADEKGASSILTLGIFHTANDQLKEATSDIIKCAANVAAGERQFQGSPEVGSTRPGDDGRSDE